jgi:hypothetical protein
MEVNVETNVGGWSVTSCHQPPAFFVGERPFRRVKIGVETWENWCCVGLPVGELSALGSKHIHQANGD